MVTLLRPRGSVPEDHTAQRARCSEDERQTVCGCVYHQHKSVMYKYGDILRDTLLEINSYDVKNLVSKLVSFHHAHSGDHSA